MTLSVEAVHANDEGLRYGCFFAQGTFSNDLFAFRPMYVPFGFVGDLENKTEFPLIVKWELCTLVDSEGWSHGIMYPDLSEFYKGEVYPAVVVAPLSKRRVAFASRAAMGQSVTRLEQPTGFHPRLAKIPAEGVTERLIFWLEYRDQSLMYDLGLRITRRDQADIPRR